MRVFAAVCTWWQFVYSRLNQWRWNNMYIRENNTACVRCESKGELGIGKYAQYFIGSYEQGWGVGVVFFVKAGVGVVA